jgi:3-hydroxyisobutyrate dehydrogenase
MKLVLNNYTLALTAGLAETIAVAETLNVDPGTFLDIIDGAPTGSPYAQQKGKMMLEDRYDPSYPARIGGQGCQADPRGIGWEARAGGRPAGRAAVPRGVEAGNGGLDMAAVYRAVRESS